MLSRPFLSYAAGSLGKTRGTRLSKIPKMTETVNVAWTLKSNLTNLEPMKPTTNPKISVQKSVITYFMIDLLSFMQFYDIVTRFTTRFIWNNLLYWNY